MSSQPYAIGVDIGGTNTRVGVLDRDARVLARMSFRTHPSRPPSEAIDRIADAVPNLLADAGIAVSAVRGVGIGCPGPVSPRAGLVFGPPAHLPNWRHVELCRELSDRTGLPAVLDNDANAAAWGEFWAGAGRGVQDMVMFTLGTGVGGGIVAAGRLMHGHFENAAELGHMIIEYDGRPCKCGQRGCLEQYASAAYTAERAMEALRGGRDSSLQRILSATGAVTSEDIVAAVRVGDALADDIWNVTCRSLAIACVNMQHLCNPARIVLAGGMANAGDVLFDRVRSHVNAMKWNLIDDLPEIVPAALGDDAGLVGAAGLLLSITEPHAA
jgi:glucokinase